MNLVSSVIIEWYLSRFGVSSSYLEYLIGLFLEGFQDVAIWLASVALLETSVIGFMIFDYTKAPSAFVFGLLFWVLSAVTAELAALAFSHLVGDYASAGYVWMALLIAVIGNIFGGSSLTANPVMKAMAKRIVGLLMRLGHTVKFKSLAKMAFSWATVTMLLVMGGLCIYKMDYYGRLSEGA